MNINTINWWKKLSYKVLKIIDYSINNTKTNALNKSIKI
jgi:hypothetical protein